MLFYTRLIKAIKQRLPTKKTLACYTDTCLRDKTSYGESSYYKGPMGLDDLLDNTDSLDDLLDNTDRSKHIVKCPPPLPKKITLYGTRLKSCYLCFAIVTEFQVKSILLQGQLFSC